MKYRVLVLGLVVAALAVLLYLNTLPNDFVFDDRQQILDNAFLRRRDGLKQIFTTDVWAFFGREAGTSYYRPLMHTVWFFAWRIFGANPEGYHAINIALHGAVSLLVFFFLKKVADARVAWIAALLFAAHPIHTEAVAWISALPDLLCTFFVMLGFWLYVRYPDTSELRLAAVTLCVSLALLSKEIGFVLPLVLLIVSRDLRLVPRPKAATLLPAVIGAGAYLFLRWKALGGLLPSDAIYRFSWTGWAALLFEYSARIALPINLSAFHNVPVPTAALQANVLAGIAIFAALIGLAAWLYRRWQPEWLAVVLFILPLAPSFPASLRENGFWIGERYLYLSSVGFCWLLAAALAALAARVGWRPVAAVTAILLTAYGARTVARNWDWRDELSFYEKELRAEGESPQLRPLLTEAYVRRGRPSVALEHARAMVRLAPNNPTAHNSLGFVYWVLNEREKALAEYRVAADQARRRGQTGFAARALNNIAVAYGQMGRPAEALAHLREAVRLDPNFADGRVNFGLALLQAGRIEEAETHLRAAVRLNPASASAQSHLGLALLAREDIPGARAALKEALRLEPSNAETLARAGEVELAEGDSRAARAFFQRALSLDPENARARAGLPRVR